MAQLIKDLPEHVREVAIKICKEEREFTKEKALNHDLVMAFIWCKTDEGHVAWDKAYYENDYSAFDHLLTTKNP